MHTPARIIGSVAAVAVAVALTACGSSGTKSSGDTTTTNATTSQVPAAAPVSHGRECTADDVKTGGGFGRPPAITIPDDCDPPTKLVVKDLVEGTGPAAVAGQPLTMNYALVTWSDKQKADSSFDRGEPFQLTLGAGQVIPGWDQGLVGIKQGGRRLLVVPPDLGYGQGGNGIKPNETLVFVTDAVKVGS